MFLFNFILASIFLSFSVQEVPDLDGWVSVERVQKHPEVFQDDEAGLWVVVSKKIGNDKFFVRFPGDPVYRCFAEGIELESSQDSDQLCLRIERKSDQDLEVYFEEKIRNLAALEETLLIKAERGIDDQVLDLFYSERGKWVWERIRATSDFFYIFRTLSDDMSGNSHRQFIASFELF